MPRPIHFEIHATDLARARRFYGELFGWTFKKFDGPLDFWLITTGADGTPGINGGLINRGAAVPPNGQMANAYVCTIGIEASVDDTVAKALTLGAIVALPRMAVPGVGWLAYLKDTEGNVFGVMREDKTAA